MSSERTANSRITTDNSVSDWHTDFDFLDARGRAHHLRQVSTTEDVLPGVKLDGKWVLVMGVSAGIGVETAQSLGARTC